MKLVKKFWDKIGEEKFVGRTITIGCTLISIYMVTVFPLPKLGAWAMGIINGFLILVEMDTDYDEGEKK